MTLPPPQSLNWSADRALLLVHGVGNAVPGSYDSLVAQLKTILAAPQEFAIYQLFYDQVNDWFAGKQQVALGVAKIVSALRSKLDATALGNAVADFAGDIVWPILLADARDAVRTMYLRQLQQIVLDGKRAGIPVRSQRLSIICHSLGCFHTFEALHEAAASTTQGLAPGTDRVQFENVIFMASPVQLIRTVAGLIDPLIPRAKTLRTVSFTPIGMPSEKIITGDVIQSAKRTVAITGKLDPVGGFILGKKLDWAYMKLEGQESHIDEQDLTNIQELDLVATLQQALSEHNPPNIVVQSPHDWGAYVARHATDLQQWLNV